VKRTCRPSEQSRLRVLAMMHRITEKNAILLSGLQSTRAITSELTRL
jgi:hypothetical protein